MKPDRALLPRGRNTKIGEDGHKIYIEEAEEFTFTLALLNR